MSESLSTFFETVVVNSDGTQKVTYSNSTTVAKRSRVIFAPALSTVAVHVSGTGTAVIKSSPFGDTSKELTLTTLTATGQYTVASANQIVVDVTAVSGTVTAALLPNED
jgi:hypothetical protein